MPPELDSLVAGLGRAIEKLSVIAADIPIRVLVVATLGGMVIGWIGGPSGTKNYSFGRLLSRLSNFALVAVLVIIIVKFNHLGPMIRELSSSGRGAQAVVDGAETRVKMASDGHFWIDAKLNGVPVSFMVDSGASITAVGAETAKQTQLTIRDDVAPLTIETANGEIEAQMGEAKTLAFGNIRANGIDVVVAPNFGDTNVLGMNFLSMLKSWRVEGKTMILVPNHPLGQSEGPAR